MECGDGSNLVRGGSAGLWLACGISTGSTGDMECESSAGSLTQDQLRVIIGDKSQNPDQQSHYKSKLLHLFLRCLVLEVWRASGGSALSQEGNS